MNADCHRSDGTGGSALAILGYHKIGKPPGDWETWFYVPTATFRDHLTYLRDHGWEIIDTARLFAALDGVSVLPQRSALLTFDDGYASFIHDALPVLLELGLPAVMFMPTDYIGQWNDFDRDNEPPEALCGWPELLTLARSGVSIQSHGASHSRMSALDSSAQARELLDSKQALENSLAQPVSLFSFPYGDWGASVGSLDDALVRTGYRAACLYGGGVNVGWRENRYRLTRLPMGPDTDLHQLLGVHSAHKKPPLTGGDD